MYTEYLADSNVIDVHELHIFSTCFYYYFTIFLSSGGKTDFECEQSKWFGNHWEKLQTSVWSQW